MVLKSSSHAQQELAVCFQGRQKYTHTPTSKSTDKSSKVKECYRCGAKHNPDQCHLKSEKCYACGKRGHIARVCRSKKKVKTTKTDSSTLATNQMTELKSTDYTLLPVGGRDGKPLQLLCM